MPKTQFSFPFSNEKIKHFLGLQQLWVNISLPFLYLRMLMYFLEIINWFASQVTKKKIYTKG